MGKQNILPTIASGVVSAALAVPLWAQTAPLQQPDNRQSARIDEIIVTAQRRAESLQNVPVSVQAFTGDSLSERGISNITELGRLAPSLTVQNTSSLVSPFIRGVGSTTLGTGMFPSVATYIDGVYAGSIKAGAIDFDDVESVQVLEGPQGALYGRNATGGAVVITTPTPQAGDPFSAKARLRLGNYDLREFNFAAGGGLGASPFAARIAASSRQREGYIENLNPPGAGAHSDDLNDRDSWSVNGALSYEPNERFSAVLRGTHAQSRDRLGFGMQAVGLEPDAALGGLNGTQAYYAGVLQSFGFSQQDAFNAASNLQFASGHNQSYDGAANSFSRGLLSGEHLPGQFAALKSDSGSVRLNYRFDSFEVSWLSAYTKLESTATSEIINANPATYPSAFNDASVGFSVNAPDESHQHELQLTSTDSPVEWVAGLVYVKASGDQLLAGDVFDFSFITAKNHWSVESSAVYAQTTMPITKAFSVTLGARYTTEEYELDDRIDPADPRSQPGVTNFGSQSKESSKTTYTARLQYDNGPMLLYGGVSTGFKGGALSPTFPGSPAVEPEEITSYETGVKWDISHDLQLNAAAFWYDYKSIHISYVDSALGGAVVLVNGASATLKGLQAQVQYQWTRELVLRASGILLESEYENDVATIGSQTGLATKGNRLAGAPKNVISIGADWHIPLGEADLKLTGEVLNSSGYYFDSENLIGTGGADDKSYTTLDLSLSYTPADERWYASVWGANVTDEAYFVAGTAAGGVLRTALAAAPRTFGLTLGVNF